MIALDCIAVIVFCGLLKVTLPYTSYLYSFFGNGAVGVLVIADYLAIRFLAVWLEMKFGRFKNLRA
jgi:hypothetical protein